MDSWVITPQTKINAPPLRANLVRRDRLAALIDNATDAKLVVLSAPPGFGKTTLLAATAQRNDRVAWLSLDNRDNIPSRFWLNVTQALRCIAPDIGSESVDAFRSAQPQYLEDAVLSLCNDMAALDSARIYQLILDDYHVIGNDTIHDTLKMLIAHLPTGWQVLVATRSTPPLLLPALRARNAVCEIGPDSLRFSPAEIRRFFEQIEKIDFDVDALAVVSDRTEGWAAALQLLAISLRTADDRDKFIRDFAGDNRLIVDFFVEEVLARQSRAVQRFLVVSAIPDRFCAPLAQSLMEGLTEPGSIDAYGMIEYVEQANLFLVSLDHQREWFRYHNLFQGLLREMARRDFGDELSRLRQKAATWLEQNLHYDDALQLLVQEEDFPGCERLIWSAAQKLFPEGQFFQLREWLKLLPASIVGQSPKMVFLASLIAFNEGQPARAKKWLSLLATLTAENPDATQDDPVLAAELRGFLLFAEAWVETNRNNSAAAHEIAPRLGRIVEQLPSPPPGTQARLNLIYGELLFQSGDFERARRIFRQGIAACRQSGYGIFAGSLYTRLAATYRVAGELRVMSRVALEGIEFIESTPAAGRLQATGYLEQMIGESLVERFQLDRASETLQEIQIRAQRAEHYLLQVIAGLSLTSAMRCLGKPDDAIRLSDEVFRLAARHDIKTWYMNGPGPTHARMLLDSGDLDRADEWVDVNELDPNDSFNYLREYEYLALGRVLIARQEFDTAASLLSRIQQQSRSAGRIRVALEAMVLASVALIAKNDKDAAGTQLKDALEIARPENYIRIFLDEGPDLIGLLRDISDSNPDNVFVGKLVRLSDQKRDRIKSITLVGGDLLSKREIEVLQLISNGCSNRDVAARLYLSPHTVKAHTRNIYDKLAVRSRTQAVAKAASLGLISPGR